MMIILAPCIPFLLAFPTVLYVESQHDNFFSMLGDGASAAFGFGSIGYLIAGVVLYYMLVNDFDRRAGRTGVSAPTPLAAGDSA